MIYFVKRANDGHITQIYEAPNLGRRPFGDGWEIADPSEVGSVGLSTNADGVSTPPPTVEERLATMEECFQILADGVLNTDSRK